MQGYNVDRTDYWLIALGVILPLLYVAAWALVSIFTWTGLFDLFLFAGPILILALWAGSGLFVAMRCIEWGRARAWRRLASGLALPLTVLAASLNVGLVWRAGQTAGDYVHLLLMYPRYLGELSELQGDRPRFAVWEWGGFGNHGYGVAYDESDEMASDHPSDAWKERADQRGVLGSGYPRALGHFYFVDLH